MNTIANYLAELIHSQLEQRSPLPVPEGLDPDQIINLSHSNHMDYLILGGLLKAENLSEEYKKICSQYVFYSLQRTIAQVQELKDIVAVCETMHIRNQPMKGSCMKFIYPRPEAREMSDIDILVDQDRMDDLAQALISKGYTLHESVRQHDVYVRPPFMVVEVHRTMYDKTIDKNQYEYFSSFSKTHLRENHSYTYDYNTEDFYVYMLAHMAKHFYARGCGIRNIVDVYVYLENFGQSMNREYVDSELNRCGILDFTRHIEELVNVWLKGESGSVFYDELFDYMLYSGIYGKDENGVWSRLAETESHGKEISPMQLKKWYYFPPFTYMARLYPWLENHVWLLPAAWIIRAFHGVIAKTGSHKQQMLHDVQSDEIRIYRDIYAKMGLHFKK